MSAGPSASALDIVRHARARRAKLAVDPVSGRVRLTLPPRAAIGAALRWAQGQSAWIAAQRAKLPQALPFADGTIFAIEGREVTIRWRADLPRTVRLEEGELLVGGPAEALPRRVTSWLKRRALALLSAETTEFAARIDVAVARVAIGDARARWGSCTTSGAIRYSWRLILAPAFVRRATVAHEVAHRVHMHHGPAFHALVQTMTAGDEVADPVAARVWLRRHGAALHWVGRES